MTTPRVEVAFVVLSAFHEPILAPVYEMLKDRVPSLLSGDLREVVAARPRVLVVCDHPGGVLWDHLPDAVVVSLRHGFGSKNYFRTSMRWYDFVCVNSAWERDMYLREDIGPRCHLASFQLFRRHVAWRSRDLRRVAPLVGDIGETEVREMRPTSSVDEHVGGLQIAVQNAAVVCRRQAGAELTCELERLVRWQPTNAPQ
jgi:hypothetical protein